MTPREVRAITAYELRCHLADEHDVRMVGADYGTLLKIHDLEHRPGLEQHHDHPEWADECREFGCTDVS